MVSAAMVGWALLALIGIVTLFALSSISWDLTTKTREVMRNAYVNNDKDPGLPAFKEDSTHGAVRPNVDFYVYSVTNAEAVVAGEQPVLESIGPFQYVQESTGREDASVADGLTTYSTSKKYTIRGSAEELQQMLQKEVVVPNVFFKDVETMALSGDKVNEYGTSAAAPLFIKLTAGQVLGSTSGKMEPLLQKEVTFRDFGGLGAEAQQDVKMKTGQKFESKGFRYIVQDGVERYCAFDEDCMPADASLAVDDDCTAGGTCQPMMVEGYELRSHAPAELFSNQGSFNHAVGNSLKQWVGKPVPQLSYSNVMETEMDTGHADAKWLLFNSPVSRTRVYQWVVSDFASRRENCQNAAGHPAGAAGLDCVSPRKSTSIAPWVDGLPIYVSFQKFATAFPKYDAILQQFGKSSAKAEELDVMKAVRKPARTFVGPVSKKLFALKGVYDPTTQVDMSELPEFEEPASFKSEVHSGEILEMELPLMFSVRIAGAPSGSSLFPNMKDTLVPVLTRRTHYRADAVKLQELAEFQFWLRALPIQLAAILYLGGTLLRLCKLLGEKRIDQFFGVGKAERTHYQVALSPENAE
jgi:hypothetical protein